MIVNVSQLIAEVLIENVNPIFSVILFGKEDAIEVSARQPSVQEISFLVFYFRPPASPPRIILPTHCFQKGFRSLSKNGGKRT